MIKCMSDSFANYILSIYGNANDPRSAASVATKQEKAAKGKALLSAAIDNSKSSNKALETLFSTVRLFAGLSLESLTKKNMGKHNDELIIGVWSLLFPQADKSRDGALDRTEFVAFLGQFPRCFDILKYVVVACAADAIFRLLAICMPLRRGQDMRERSTNVCMSHPQLVFFLKLLTSFLHACMCLPVMDVPFTCSRFFVKPIAEDPGPQIYSSAGAGAAYATY